MADTPRVKICGLTRPRDAKLADELGADYLGVVLTAGFSRSVEPAVAGRVVAGTAATKVAVLVDEVPEAAERHARRIDAGVIQLCGDEGVAAVQELRDRGHWTIWKSVRARSAEDVLHAVERYGEVVDGVLVEGWKAGVVGGGGAKLAVAPEEVRAAVPAELDFVLAGGLTPDSVAEALALFRPTVVDVSSGVESVLGEKDPALLERFIEASRAAPHLLVNEAVEPTTEELT